MKPFIVIAPLMLVACAQQPIAVVEPICTSMAVIWVSKSDTLSQRTAEAIEGHNLAHEKLCGPSPRPPRPEPKAKKTEVPVS